jgi:hypothetical protein
VRSRTAEFAGAVTGTVTITETTWPPPWGPVVAQVTIRR